MAKEKRGFASMDEEERREIAKKGGKASHERGQAHEFTPEEAREAGKKGGRKKQKRSTEEMYDNDMYDRF
jgi:general stress protein YciG